MPDILHFPRDRTNFDPDLMLGPDRDGRRLTIASAVYDVAANVTTATLRAVLPDRFRTLVEPLVAQQRERQRIREVFNG